MTDSDRLTRAASVLASAIVISKPVGGDEPPDFSEVAATLVTSFAVVMIMKGVKDEAIQRSLAIALDGLRSMPLFSSIAMEIACTSAAEHVAKSETATVVADRSVPN